MFSIVNSIVAIFFWVIDNFISVLSATAISIAVWYFKMRIKFGFDKQKKLHEKQLDAIEEFNQNILDYEAKASKLLLHGVLNDTRHNELQNELNIAFEKLQKCYLTKSYLFKKATYKNIEKLLELDRKIYFFIIHNKNDEIKTAVRVKFDEAYDFLHKDFIAIKKSIETDFREILGTK